MWLSLFFNHIIHFNCFYYSIWSRGHVPYRDSKLTRILQPALGGNANTAIICNITLAQVTFCSHSNLSWLTLLKAQVLWFHLFFMLLITFVDSRFMQTRQRVVYCLQAERCVSRIVHMWMRYFFAVLYLFLCFLSSKTLLKCFIIWAYVLMPACRLWMSFFSFLLEE